MLSEEDNPEIDPEFWRTKNVSSPEEEEIETTNKGNAELLRSLKEKYCHWLAIDQDIESLEIILASMLDRKVLGDPLWLFVVAPPGSTKTEILRSIYGLKSIAYHLSSLTSKTIISGRENKQGNIVKGIYSKINGKVVIIPELSEVLSKTRDERNAIFAQFRDLYDGRCVYGYGTTDEPIAVDCNIGLVCGATSAVDMYGSVHAVLGERFLKVRPQFNRELAKNRALENQKQLTWMRQQLALEAENFFTKLHINEPTISDEQAKKIGNLGEFTGYVRTTVTNLGFNEFDTSEWQPEPEFPTRISQQLQKLAKCLAIIRGKDEVTDDEIKTLSRVAKDSCIPNRLRTLEVIHRHTEPQTIQQIAKETGLDFKKARNSLEALSVIKMLEHTLDISGDRFQLRPEHRTMCDNMFGQLNIPPIAQEPEETQEQALARCEAKAVAVNARYMSKPGPVTPSTLSSS
jgi:hypothetical protein